jgi:hypothetical protein
MKLEVVIFLLQMSLVPVVTLIYGLRYAVLAFAILAYGPAMSIIKVTGLPMGSILSLLGILSLLRIPLSPRLFLFLLLLLGSCFAIAVHQGTFLGLTYAIHYIIYAIFGLLLGNFISRFSHQEEELFLSSLLIFGTVSFIIALVVRQLLSLDHVLRDVGFGVLPLFIFLVSLAMKGPIPRLAGVGALIFLFLGQTRSYIFALLILLFIGQLSFKIVSKEPTLLKKLYILLIFSGVTSMLWFIIDMRMLDGIDDDSVVAILSLQTRLNGLSQELADFLASPLLGNGIGYYQTAALELISTETFSDEEYTAYNHIGYVGVLAQSGILGFIVIIIIPIQQLVRSWRSVGEGTGDLLKLFCLILLGYFLLFFVSGSPMRRDYSDSIFFFIGVGYLLASRYRRRPKSALISQP